MQFIHPELVGEIPSANHTSAIETTPYGWNSLDFGDSGVIGDPTYATPQAGEEFYHFAVNNVCDTLNSISNLSQDLGNNHPHKV
jgi:creatinine amidohydrolase/Fe(II)-dependent formamide hydrolase-like protein